MDSAHASAALKIRTADSADIPQLCDLLDDLFSLESEFTPDRPAQERGLAMIVADPSVGTIFVARQDGQCVGMVGILYSISTALGARVAMLEDMVVRGDRRGQGIGDGLLRHAIEAARANGCKRITLLTDGTNEGARRFYRGHGYELSAMVPMRLALN